MAKTLVALLIFRIVIFHVFLHFPELIIFVLMNFQVHDQQRELQQLQKQLGKATLECEELSQGSTSLKGKVVYDEKDPHRPRFSLPELRDILQERNALKARVSDLEDELAVFRPRPLTSSS